MKDIIDKVRLIRELEPTIPLSTQLLTTVSPQSKFTTLNHELTENIVFKFHQTHIIDSLSLNLAIKELSYSMGGREERQRYSKPSELFDILCDLWLKCHAIENPPEKSTETPVTEEQKAIWLYQAVKEIHRQEAEAFKEDPLSVIGEGYEEKYATVVRREFGSSRNQVAN